jgi:integrase
LEDAESPGAGSHSARRYAGGRGSQEKVSDLGRVCPQVTRLARERHLAELHRVDPIAYLEDVPDLLLDDQDGRPSRAPDVRDLLKDCRHEIRREPQRRLVEHEELWLRNQRPGQGQHLLLSARQPAGVLAKALFQHGKQVQHPGNPFLRFLSLERTATDLQVLHNRQVGEDPVALRRKGNPARHVLGEVLNLTWRDIDFAEGRLRVVAKRGEADMLDWSPKDKDMRILPVPAPAINLLTKLQLDPSAGGVYLFVIGKGPNAGQRMGRNNVWRDFDAIRRKAGLPKCCMHDLRRSFCTNLSRAMPMHVVQELAGHSDIRTTRRFYVQVEPELMQRACRALETALDEVMETENGSE